MQNYRLKDYGLDYKTICDYVYDVDSKFDNPIQKENPKEIENTILSTLYNRMEKENCLQGKQTKNKK